LLDALEGRVGVLMIQLVLAVYAAVCAASTIAFVALTLASKGMEAHGLAALEEFE
jgi:hypothetical protein